MRGISAKLQRWQTAGIIDAAQVEAIKKFEADQGQKWFWSSLGLSAILAVLLGISLIIAANWGAIPASVKIAVHFAANIGVAALILRRVAPKWHDGFVLLLFGLTLTLMALISQTFQLQGEVLDLIRVWFWGGAPFLFVHLRSKYLRIAWACGALAMVGVELSYVIDRIPPDAHEAFVLGVAGYILLAASIARRPLIECFSAAAALTSLSLASVVVGISDYGLMAPEKLYVTPIAAILAVAAAPILLKTQALDAKVTAACVLGIVASILLPDYHVLNIAFYSVFWIAIAYLGYYHSSIGMARLGLILFVGRMLYEFATVFDGLLKSGFGFIIGGAILYGLFRIGRRADERLRTLVANRQRGAS